MDRFGLLDWQGSTRYLSDGANGTSFPSALRYDTYGQRTAEAGADGWLPTTFQWGGGLGDQTEYSSPTEPGTGLDLLGQREYDPSTGRFVSPDPIGLAGGLNLYAYAGDDPVNNADPSGQDWSTFGRGVARGTAGIVVAAGIVAGATAIAPALGAAVAIGGAAYGGWEIGEKIRENFTGRDYHTGELLSPDQLDENSGLLFVGACSFALGGRAAREPGGYAPTPENSAPPSLVAQRLAQDAAVEPKPPAPLPTTRPVSSSPAQNAQVQTDIAAAKIQGGREFLVNQQQVNAAGVRVGINRPDLQYTIGGQRYYIEYDSPSSGRGPGHQARIQANDPTGIVILKIIP